ncbi:olfactory guanylyl cyclase GC-D-like [Sarcophilus harrisii]|uniref:olfactory guanylyl cyclase GC-D-like n=1 Tax=Sarcophilus harrisii TaxID=9305 RepID=UPI001301EF9D|nr:olfactory guanylyl cyclase GC-D-like [Sarcophilus harrisii]
MIPEASLWDFLNGKILDLLCLVYNSLWLWLPRLVWGFPFSFLRAPWLVLLSVMLCCLLLGAPLSPNSTQDEESFTVGVLGPWECDLLFTKALPHVAAHLAITRAKREFLLELSTRLDYVILEEGCNTAQSLATFLSYRSAVSTFVGPSNPGYCPAAALLGQNWGKALFSWACGAPESGGTLVPTLPSTIQVLLAVLRHFGWAHVAVISSHQDVWVDTAQQVISALRTHGLPVGPVTSLGPGGQGAIRALKQLQDTSRLKVVVMCMHSLLVGGSEQEVLLAQAHALGLTDGRYVFIPYDALLYGTPYRNRSYPVLRDAGGLQEAYDAVLTISLESGTTDFDGAFSAARKSGEITANTEPEQVSPLFGTIYDAIFLLANALNHSKKQGGQLSGNHLRDHIMSLDLAGFSQRIQTDERGNRLARYVILDTDGQKNQLIPTHLLDMSTLSVQSLGRPIHFPQGISPPPDSNCWFDPDTLCTGDGWSLIPLLAVISLSTLVLGGLGLIYLMRTLQFQPGGGPNKVILTMVDLTFTHPPLNQRKLTLDTLSNSRNPSDVKSLSSDVQSPGRALPATPESSNMALYQGDWVWLKKFKTGTSSELRQSSVKLLKKMRDLRHENVGLCLGFFTDLGVSAIVFEHCCRGSLEDLLKNEALRLDWTFKSSLLMDLIKGVRYLHHRGFPHGSLKSRNCVVDGRFVLKVTDYGYLDLLERQRVPYSQPLPEELLWTAPELLREAEGPWRGTFKGDVYSFAIILQEVLARGPPYCTSGLSAEEIIRKLVSPPPLCRPVVSPDQGPPECLRLMKQCWSEDPEDRPSLDDIFSQFKSINQGKKSSVADSMLRLLEKYSHDLEDLVQARTEELELEKQKTEKLLSQMLPQSVAEALKAGTTVIPEYFDQVTIYFSDIVGFTIISALSEPMEVVDLLNDLYTLFDAVLNSHDVYKVETIGDAYMVASGLPRRNGTRHAAEIANLALDILSSVGDFRMRHVPEVPVRIRAGLHSGPCVAGVVGLTMPRYCLFGDTVNTASRMESTGLPYRIHVSGSTVQTLASLNEGYKIEVRGQTELKGKGIEETYWLVGKTGFPKELPKPMDIKPGDAWQEMVNQEIKSSFRKASRSSGRSKSSEKAEPAP